MAKLQNPIKYRPSARALSEQARALLIIAITLHIWLRDSHMKDRLSAAGGTAKQRCTSREPARRCGTINHRYTRTVSPPSPISLTPSPPHARPRRRHARPRRRLPWSGPQGCHRTHPRQVQLLCTSTTHDPNNTRRKCHDGRELSPPLNRSPEHVCGYSHPRCRCFASRHVPVAAQAVYRAFGRSPRGTGGQTLPG
jgi:hypothetical protein